MIFLALAVYFCIYISTQFGYGVGMTLGLIPFILFFIFATINKPLISLGLLLILNYFIMGIGRYIQYSIPTTNIYDLFFALIFSSIILRQIAKREDFSNIFNPYTFLSLTWLLYCIINIGNGITGELHTEAWLKAIRPLALYSLLTCLIVSITCDHYKFIRYFFILWGILTLLAAAKGYWQKVHGFDATEYAWLMTRGRSTHIIHSGIRYFSFFTDAANYGCSMGFSNVVFFLSSFYTKNKYEKLFYLIVSAAGFYGFLVSGTRAAIAVPIAGLAFYAFLSKNWKTGLFAFMILISGLAILKYTTVGGSNSMIRRMRTALDTDDASFQVRIENQKALKAYMSETPFGIGLGVDNENVPPSNKYYFVATCPPDSDLVNIWIRTGAIGLSIYIIVHCFLFSSASYILLFRIKNPEIRGPLTAMLCGCAGMFVASYANMIYFQFPNGPIIYTCYTLVFLAPFFDKQYTAEHELTA